ncbi:hypothetical protein AB0K20_04775 [Micromonospora matsumotoense]|uniref:Uncharacterized protein n=1 Tax=Micromonospora matsumotoense TaxID=121616 RepID=A0A1C4YJ28_9ACTN|nr:hypothetical protein [Micromonospora matsumotoense]SCF20729.1 hypothetical protein GA0070216_106256 [Micromonospora matsumotoense]
MTRVRLSGKPRALAALVAIAVSAALLAVASPTQAAPRAAGADAAKPSAGSSATGGATAGRLAPLSAGATGPSAGSYGTLASTSVTGTVGSITVTCTLTPSTPFVYYGGPYGGGEEGLATVRCTYPVYAAQVEVALFRYGTQVTYNTYTNYSTTTTTADTEYPRSSGEYKTGADAFITWSYGGPTTFIPLTFSNSIYL